MSELDGVLPVDKPEGPTSHDVVGMARRALRTRRIGHTGTLDPFASGLLLLCVGPATRLSEYLTAQSKRYLATLRLGEVTDTDDRTGEVIARDEGWRSVGESAVRDALQAQVGTLQQLPPRFSAKKVAGERMYAAARRGEELERVPVQVTVHSIELLRFELPEVDIEVHCGSGTYIRAIARDVGAALGVGGHLSALRRTAIGPHSLENALAVAALDDEARVAAALLPPAEALAPMPRLRLAEAEARRVLHGNAIAAPPEAPAAGTVALLAPGGELLAVAERRGPQLHPRKVFA